ncbi:MAG: BamA/TamA family outer membrane protein [Bacteroidales bacterium]|nr:BamA/TamA family outer membrane protein [Bacteroidales bacterium]
MKKMFLAAVLMIGCTLSSLAQEVAKTGLNFGPLPAVGYSSDLGWHYGALTDIYWYGDGSTYPDYIWKANVEASWYSKGNSVYHAFFDSKYVIPGARLSVDLSYFGNKTDNFYGFNGASSLYVPELDKITDGKGIYLMQRDILRSAVVLQGKFGDSAWGWAGGVTFYDIRTGHAQNKSLDPKTDLSLYDLYVIHNVIPVKEMTGGKHLEFKGGFVYDTRDHENNPTRGSNLEIYAFGSPDFISKHDNSYLKLAAHWKQFFPLVSDRLVLGYHLAYQGQIAGNAPYYLLQTIQTINLKQIRPEGLGSTCTVRGTVYNRLQGNSYAWSNVELRWSFAKFRWINQNWTIATNPFFDAGMVVSPYRKEQMESLLKDNTVMASVDGKNYTASDFYTKNAEKLHTSAGIGLHFIMNQNFNINFEVGKCLDPNDGNIGINIGLNYIF